MDPNASKEQNQAALANVAKEKAQLLADKIPQKHKDLAKEQSEKAQNYIKEKFPEERRNQFYYRLKKVVVECQRHKDYQDAMDYFLNFFEQYKGHAAHIADQSAKAAQNVRSEGNVATAETTFRRLIERFADGAPTQPIIDAVDQIYTDVANDPELKEWFSRLNTYIRKCLQEPGFIMKDEANTQARQLTESGKKFFVAADGRSQGKYVAHKDAVFRELTHFAKAMNADPLNRKLGDNVQQITKDLFLNSEGGLTFKPPPLERHPRPHPPRAAQPRRPCSSAAHRVHRQAGRPRHREPRHRLAQHSALADRDGHPQPLPALAV